MRRRGRHGTEGRRTAGAVLLAVAVGGALAGCAASTQQQDACLLGDTMGFTSPGQLAGLTATVVRGRVTGVAAARDASAGFVAEPVTLTVDEVPRAVGTAPAPGSSATVDLFVVDPDCPGGRETPTPGDVGNPVESEVPAVGTEVVVYLGAPGDDESAATVRGYARVDGDRATFVGTAGPLRGQTFDVAELERIARDAPATPTPR